MFDNLLQFWKGKDFLCEVLEEFKQMLEDAEKMFTSVCRKLIYNEGEPGLKDTVYEIDKKINDLQKKIRTRIVEHLSLQPSVDIATCLLLMSVVKDAERLGDYAKNLFEVTQLLDKPIDKNRYEQLFDDIHNVIIELFHRTQEAFIGSDENKAKSSWKFETTIGQQCQSIIAQAAKSQGDTNEAVCFALIARYYKRIAAHLTNIATSVILPISELDYFDEPKKKNKTKE